MVKMFKVELNKPALSYSVGEKIQFKVFATNDFLKVEQPNMRYELTTDDGKKLKFYFVGTIEFKGKFYSAFEPAEQIDGIEDDDLVIFELSGDDEETADLLPIEDEQLLDEVFEEFCRVLEEDELAEEAEKLEK